MKPWEPWLLDWKRESPEPSQVNQRHALTQGERQIKKNSKGLWAFDTLPSTSCWEPRRHQNASSTLLFLLRYCPAFFSCFWSSRLMEGCYSYLLTEGIVALVITWLARQRGHMQFGSMLLLSSINGWHTTNLFLNSVLSRYNTHRHILVSLFLHVHCFMCAKWLQCTCTC